MIDPARIRVLHDRPPRRDGAFVLYWMQASQRTRFNHALEHAAGLANDLRQPLVVGFGLTDDYPEANARHYAFMLQGLRDVGRNLERRRVRFVCRRGSPPDVAVKLARRASIVVCDRGYLRHQKRWRDDVADRAGCRVVEVESDVVVPADVASTKKEFAARTIRPKILKQRDAFLVAPPTVRLKKASLDLDLGDGSIDLSDPLKLTTSLRLDASVTPSPLLTGGEDAARERLNEFVTKKLARYDAHRSEPAAGGTSMLAAYLHFGQASPVEVALAVREAASGSGEPGAEAFLEELIVRRELAVNFVHYEPRYDTYAGAVPAWARQTLKKHAKDRRPHVYTLRQLESAATGDAYWNAAQREMVVTGFMHNTMRMYWGKKILEWSRTPEAAYKAALYLNNKYFLCGRDPNAYANVAWLFGLHDRPWGERDVFGTVRYMNAAGLDRKFDMDAYVTKVAAL